MCKVSGCPQRPDPVGGTNRGSRTDPEVDGIRQVAINLDEEKA